MTAPAAGLGLGCITSGASIFLIARIDHFCEHDLEA